MIAALALATKVTKSASAAMPAFDRVRLESESGKLTLRATNTTDWFVARLDTPFAGPAIIVPAQALYQEVERAGGATLTVDTPDSQPTLVVEGKSGGRAFYPDCSLDGFPAWTKVEDLTSIASFDAASLKAALDRVAPAIDRGRLHQCRGMHVGLAPAGGCRFVATDGLQLRYADIPCCGSSVLPPGTVWDRASVEHARALLGAASGEVYVEVMVKHLTVASARFSLTSELAAEEFPEWQSTLGAPTRSTTFVAKDLVTALDDVCARASGRSWVTVEFSKHAIELALSTPDFGSRSYIIPAQLDGKPLVAGLDAKQLASALRALTSETATLRFSTALAPFRIEEPGFLAIVRPCPLDR